jgi:hypothetical protein
MKTVEYTAEVLPDGKVDLPQEILRSLHLRSGSRVRILLMCDE